MPQTLSTAVFDQRFARDFWGLARHYWATPSGVRGAGLLLGCIGLECGAVYGNVLLARTQHDIFDSIQNRATADFFAHIQVFIALALLFVFVAAYRIYVRNILAMRWREQLTRYFVGRWVAPDAYWLRELHGQDVDNPDQRVADDINTYVSSGLGLFLSLLSAVVTLVSFASMLWALSVAWPVPLDSFQLHIPGMMMWVALTYSIIATWLTDRIGLPLVRINFDRLRVEADFRYRLVHFRDNVEAVAVARGERVEQQGLVDRFGAIMANWWLLIAAQRNLALLTTGLGQANGIVPLLVAAPAYFAGQMSLGSLTQTQIAYAQVSGALAFFVNAYQEIAVWRASMQRLVAFRDRFNSTRVEIAHQRGIHIEPAPDDALRLVDLTLITPDGRPLLSEANATLRPGERVELYGPAGIGKTTLFRALAGLWPFGTGRIQLPAGTRALFLPQRPYLPIATLRDAVSYPSPSGTFSDEQIRATLHLLNLNRLEHRLDDSEQWDQRLSVDEHERLTIARLLLHEPDWIVMDDATEGLDATTERRVYAILEQQLPNAGVLSIVNRPNAAGAAQQHWEIRPREDGGAALHAP